MANGDYGKSMKTPEGAKQKERHMIAMTGKAKGKKMNYCGPFTFYVARKKRGDKPVNWNDKCCMAHDAVYNRKDATRKEIQKSDDDMRKCMKRNPNKSIGSKVEDKIMATVFKGKRKLENIGVLDPAKLTDTKIYKDEKKGSWLKEKLKERIGKKVAGDRKAQHKRKVVKAKEHAAKLKGQIDNQEKITSAIKVEAKRSMDQPHLAKEPKNVSLEGYDGDGISRKMNVVNWFAN